MIRFTPFIDPYIEEHRLDPDPLKRDHRFNVNRQDINHDFPSGYVDAVRKLQKHSKTANNDIDYFIEESIMKENAKTDMSGQGLSLPGAPRFRPRQKITVPPRVVGQGFPSNETGSVRF